MGARRVAVLLHGRGQEPAYLLEHLVLRIDDPDVAYVLPAASGGSWYPGRFNEPRIANEPLLGQALEAAEATARALEEAGARVELQVSDDREHRIRDAAVAGVRALLG